MIHSARQLAAAIAIFIVTSASASGQGIDLGPELNGAWFDTASPGQGFLLDVNPEINFLFGAWFSYKPGLPTMVDGENHRWYIFNGNLDDEDRELVISRTAGGVFNDPEPVSTFPVGLAGLQVFGCNKASFEFAFDDGPAATILLTRALPVTESLCQDLKSAIWQAFKTDSFHPSTGASTSVGLLERPSMTASLLLVDLGEETQLLSGPDDRVYIVREGMGDLRVGGQQFPAEKDRILFVRAEAEHRFENVVEPLEITQIESRSASSVADPESISFDLSSIQASQSQFNNDWRRFLDVSSMHLGSYSLPRVAGGDGPLVHGVDEINIVTQGEATFHIGQETVRIGPGSVVWVAEGNSHFFDELSEDFKVLIMFPQKPGVNTP